MKGFSEHDLSAVAFKGNALESLLQSCPEHTHIWQTLMSRWGVDVIPAGVRTRKNGKGTIETIILTFLAENTKRDILKKAFDEGAELAFQDVGYKRFSIELTISEQRFFDMVVTDLSKAREEITGSCDLAAQDSITLQKPDPLNIIGLQRQVANRRIRIACTDKGTVARVRAALVFLMKQIDPAAEISIREQKKESKKKQAQKKTARRPNKGKEWSRK